MQIPGFTPAGIQAGPANELGWHELGEVPGAPRGSVRVGEGPRAGATALAAFIHLSDVHLCDAESPARQVFLERWVDPSSVYKERIGSAGVYRPQEFLTVQVGVAAIEAANRIGKAPVSGVDLQAVVATGDVTDNAQANELGWYQSLMAGGVIQPWSGDEARSSWVGAVPTVEEDWSEFYWHPDGAPDGVQPDRPTTYFGYPTIPGLVDAARQPVTSPGLGLPWLTVHGNHDLLAHGTVVYDKTLQQVLLADERKIDLARGQSPFVMIQSNAEVGPALYPYREDAPGVPIAADENRRFVGEDGFTSVLGESVPAADADASTRYWTADLGELRLIALDTVNPYGGWQGSLDQEQFAWLREQLVAAQVDRRYVAILSHHPSWTLFNPYHPTSEPRALVDEVLELLLSFPNVIAWVSGHVHANTSFWHAGPDGVSGLWEITTASLIDWPQQFRVLEVLKEPGGTVVIVSTIVDHVGPALPVSQQDHTSVAGMAGISRTLASNDYRHRQNLWRRMAMTGLDKDLDAVWRVPDPWA